MLEYSKLIYSQQGEDRMRYPLSEKDIFPYRAKPFYFITTKDPNELTVEKFNFQLLRF